MPGGVSRGMGASGSVQRRHACEKGAVEEERCGGDVDLEPTGTAELSWLGMKNRRNEKRKGRCVKQSKAEED